MIKLSKKNIPEIASTKVISPDERLFNLPERILQFGTGVLLRGLCDFFVHDANMKGVFNGRIIVVKSTEAGDTDAFRDQDNLYTICVRGLGNGNIVEENIICSAISRVLSAKDNWNLILKAVEEPSLNIIISNTTEVGLQLVRESIHNSVPSSFPAKLLAVLWKRYAVLGKSENSRMVVILTELISDNGDKLYAIVKELAAHNHIEKDFLNWMETNVIFCNSLVDRIVTKDPGKELLDKIQTDLGYHDALLTMCEDYRLWAIEGPAEVEKLLPFAATREGAFVKEDIDVFKFLKLHLLNGTHTLSASLAFLAGFDIVREAMEDKVFSGFVEHLMLKDIARAIPYKIPETEINSFSLKVLDRFRNPFLQHKWINITFQNTMKMKNRNVPVLLRYQELYGKSPDYMSMGFAGYLLFMKVVRKEGDKYYGRKGDEFYPVSDDQAPYFFNLWTNEHSIQKIVHTVLSNTELWGTDLSSFTPFMQSVEEKLTSMINNGVLHTIKSI